MVAPVIAAAGISALGSIASSIFGKGKAPKATVTTMPTLTPEQQMALNQILRDQSGTDPTATFQGSVESNPIPLENLSLGALENRVNQIATGGSPTEIAANNKVLDIISNNGTPTGGQQFEDFFKTNIEQPLTQRFQDNYSQLGARFGGNSLFSSDRAEADARNKNDFLKNVTASRADLAYQERQKSIENLMTALGIVSNDKGKTTAELGQIANTAFGERAFAADNANNRFKQFVTEQALKQQRIDNMLKAIQTPAFENISTVTGGQSGFGPSLIQAGGSVLASMISSGFFNNNNKAGQVPNSITATPWNMNPNSIPVDWLPEDSCSQFEQVRGLKNGHCC